MAHPSIRRSQSWLCKLRADFSGVLLLAIFAVLPFCSSQSLHGQNSAQVEACKAGTCVSFCADLGVSVKQRGACISSCRKSCQTTPQNPPPITLTPKYLIMALVYAPPGCTSGNPTQCGTNNGSSFVDYGSASSNGTKITNKDSFQLGVTISYDNSSLAGGLLGGGGSYGFSETDSDSTAVNVTKTKTYDLKALGNGDGIDHGQDMFLLLLRPSVTLKKNGNTILWSFTNGGSLYEVLVSELRNTSTMRPAVAKVFNELGFTNQDYQSILSEDPFGGTVNTGSTTTHGALGTLSGGVFTTGGNGPTLDGRRFWYTGWNFPYEPTKASTSCNNGVCNCTAITNSFTNDRATDHITEDVGQTTVDLFGSAGVPKVWSLKLDTKMVWTTTGTTDNSTDSKQSASATITCPSVNYTGDTEMAVYWDSRYGSFLFVPYDPGATTMMHLGQIMDASGHAIGGRLVQMTYGGKTYRTFTAPDGTYRFPSPTGKPVRGGTAEILTGGKRQTVNLGIHPQ